MLKRVAAYWAQLHGHVGYGIFCPRAVPSCRGKMMGLIFCSHAVSLPCRCGQTKKPLSCMRTGAFAAADRAVI